MQPNSYFREYFDLIERGMSSIDTGLLEQVAATIHQVQKLGRKIIIVGNGGSAAIASHVAVDFTKAAKIRALSFNEPDLITCFANDYGYDQWVVKALESYADKGDLVILISSSGKSPNIINAAQTAKLMGLSVVTLSGFNANNPLRKIGDYNLWVDSLAYNVVEMAHQIWLLAIVDYLATTA
jgi:D-sedoheptulose 7-phosphate isomerase